MIWHFLEIWILLLAAFVVGCMLGSMLYAVVARSSAARSQEALADAIGDLVDGLKTRLGITPAWRPEYRRRAEEEPWDEEVASADREGSAAAGFAQTRDRGQSREREVAAPVGRDLDDDWELPDQEPEVDWEGEPVWDEEEPAPVRPAKSADGPGASVLAAMRPAGLASARNGVPDDLQRIRGIGKRNEELLNGLGIFHFSQIAAWTPAEVRWVANFLSFPERIDRDDWIGQATVLGSGGNTGYIKAAARRRARRQDDPGSEEAYDLIGDGAQRPPVEYEPDVPDFIEPEPIADDDVLEPLDEGETVELAVLDEAVAGAEQGESGADAPDNGEPGPQPAAEPVEGVDTGPTGDPPPAEPQANEEVADEPVRPETSGARS